MTEVLSWGKHAANVLCFFANFDGEVGHLTAEQVPDGFGPTSGQLRSRRAKWTCHTHVDEDVGQSVKHFGDGGSRGRMLRQCEDQTEAVQAKARMKGH